MIDHDFWRARRIFLTGHTGFKGSWLSLWLRELGATVTGYAQAPSTTPNLFDLSRVPDTGMHSIIGDVRDPDALTSALVDSRADVVIHMAAQSLVRPSYEDPVGTYATNLMGTVHLLEAVRRSGAVRSVLVVTSDKCYQNHEWTWGYRESDAMGGSDPYSSSKGCAELITAAYRASYFHSEKLSRTGTAVATARAGNVIGGGDWARDRLVPDLVRAFSCHSTATIRNPLAIRPWQHVVEPLSGYLLLAQRLHERGSEFAEAWNFGPRLEDTKSVAWVADRVANAWGEGTSWQIDGDAHPHETRSLRLDCSMAHARLGWVPRWSLDESLRRTVEWYRAVRANPTVARAATLADLRAFEGTHSAVNAVDSGEPEAARHP